MFEQRVGEELGFVSSCEEYFAKMPFCFPPSFCLTSICARGRAAVVRGDRYPVWQAQPCFMEMIHIPRRNLGLFESGPARPSYPQQVGHRELDFPSSCSVHLSVNRPTCEGGEN